MARQQERKIGRYDEVGSALHPGGEFLPEGKRRHGNVEIVHARLEDPAELRAAHLRAGKFQKTMVNVARDPLEREYRYGRLDRLQHAAGLRYRSVLARAAGRGDPGASGLRSGSWDASEYKTIRMLDAARAAVELRQDAIAVCGSRGEMILTAVLGDEFSFKETAIKISTEPGAPRLWRTQEGAARVAREFREGLKLLADEWFAATAR